jgi:thiol-disulfide isomerase/thioredoxin
MVSVQLAALALAISGVGETALLDFQAPWCGPCQSMSATVDQLTAAGYPLKKINVDQQRELASKYGVTSIPCFVLIVNGKEAGRIVGPASLDELQGLCAKNGVRSTTVARGQSPDDKPRRPFLDSLRPKNLLAAATGKDQAEAKLVPVTLETSAGPFARSSQPSSENAQPISAQELLSVSVRLTIEDAQGYSYGTGTLIDSRQGEALILTCGHIFRDSQGKGRILVDLFGPDAKQKIPGQLITYDLTRDVGLVSITTGSPVRVAHVAPPGYVSRRGEKVFTVGCNHGADPTVLASQVNSVNKFSGPKNVQVAGQPVQGRSGGGLFRADGMVIGVCNAADPADNEGLYAAAQTVHEVLDQAKLSDVYRRPNPQQEPPTLLASATSPDRPNMTTAPAAGSARAPAMPAATPAVHREGAASGMAASDPFQQANSRAAAVQQAAAVMESHENAEVICIIRPLKEGNAKSEIVVLDRASTQFLTQLAAERNVQDARHLTSHDVPRKAPGVAPVYTSDAGANRVRR